MIRKCLSLEFRSGGPNDYNTVYSNGVRNRDIVLGGNNTWVKFFVDWSTMQPLPGAISIQTSWLALNTANWGYLDAAIRSANVDGRGVILTLQSNFPLWANGNPLGFTEFGTNKDPRRKPPLATDVNSPWGWWIAYLFARYRPGAPVNAGGPNPLGPNIYGNPQGAWVNAIEFVNEPNYLWWRNAVGTDFLSPDPVAGGNNLVLRCAQMFQTAEYYAYGFQSAAVIGPSVHDNDAAVNDPDAMGSSEFTHRVLAGLSAFRPRVYAGWSMHSYNDVKTGVVSRTQNVINHLYADQWKGPSGDRTLWITESGYRIPAAQVDPMTAVATPAGQTDQNTLVTSNFNAVKGIPEVYLSSQHEISDQIGNSFYSGMWNGTGATPPYALGTARLLAYGWSGLIAATTP